MKKTRAQRNKERKLILSNPRALDKVEIAFESDDEKLHLKSTFKLNNFSNLMTVLFIPAGLAPFVYCLINGVSIFVLAFYGVVALGSFLISFVVILLAITSFVSISEGEIHYRRAFKSQKITIKQSMLIKPKSKTEKVVNRKPRHEYYEQTIELMLIDGDNEVHLFDFVVDDKYSWEVNELSHVIVEKMNKRLQVK